MSTPLLAALAIALMAVLYFVFMPGGGDDA